MPLVPSAETITAAVNAGYAVPHFNVCNLEVALAVADVAEELSSPVIFGIHPVESEYAGIQNLVALISSMVQSRGLTASIHLDHGSTFEQAVQCIRHGYTSVMFDGSTMSLDENLRITRDVVHVAHAAGVSVEAEVGTIGGTAEYGGEIENAHLADPAACKAMGETGIDALAVAIGNAHGVYIAEPKLDFDLLAEIRSQTDVPLVLHGGSGIPSEQVQKAIGMGVAKFNVGTALHVAFREALRKGIAENPDSNEMFEYLEAAQAAMRSVVRDYVGIAMSAGRA
jgi:fructose-bisphosphate aldolase class II